MKSCKACLVEKPESEFYPHPGYADKLRPICRCCVKISVQQWREQNREQVRANNRASYERRKEVRKIAHRAYRQANKAKCYAASRKWAKENWEHYLAVVREWRYMNPDKVALKKIKRDRGLLYATPVWANQTLIRQQYQWAREVTRQLGWAHEVDHIVPLQGKNVCGLHVEYNLQVISADENKRKGSKFNGAALAA